MILTWVEFCLSMSACYFSLQISGRLFSDSGPRRSSRLSADSGANTNASVATVSGNGNNASKYLGGSKLSSLALRSVTLRKGHSWANENIDEGCDSHSMHFIIILFEIWSAVNFVNSFLFIVCVYVIPKALSFLLFRSSWGTF